MSYSEWHQDNIRALFRKRVRILTEAVKFEHGTYYRLGNRIYISSDNVPPGINAKLETRRKELTAFRNLLGEIRAGVSYEVEGWSEGLK